MSMKVPLLFRQAKLRQQKSFHSRESVLNISKRILDVHSLDNDSFKRLENLGSSGSGFRRDKKENKEFEEMKSYNPGITDYPNLS